MKDDKIKKCLIAGYDMDIISQEEMGILWNYITNLQEELKSANESITWWNNRYNALQEENKQLKEEIEILTSDDDNDSVWLEDYNI